MGKTVCIIGLGLIGASLALGIKKAHPNYKIVASTLGKENQKLALDRGVADQVSDNLAVLTSQADVIILCLPIQKIIQVLKELGNQELKDGVLITDVGSTKGEVVCAAKKYLSHKEISFIGGHPMAGSHKSGILAADSHLFENAYYILTPCELTGNTAVSNLKDLLSGIGARFIELNAAEHDQVTSQVSHFPHLLASNLVLQTGEFSQTHPLAENFAAGGFRDMTRIAESDPTMWTDILITNKEAILHRVEAFQKRLDWVSDLLRTGDREAIWALFHKGKQVRKKMEIHKRAGIDSFFDLFLTIPDQEDTILRVLTILKGISIVNLHINEENREDIYGVLQITFKNKEDLAKAVTRLERETDYHISVH